MSAIEDHWKTSWRTFLAASRDNVGILVVDDESVIRKLLYTLLSGKGYRVRTCGSAEEAWEEIQSNEFDLLLVDKNLPGASGIELIARVADEGLEIDSIMITAYASVASIATALDAGASDYIAKPFDLDRVLTRIASVIQRRHLGRLYAETIADLRAAMHVGEGKLERVGTVATELQRFRLILGARPDVLVVEPNGDRMQRSSQALAGAGLTVRSVTNADTATRMLASVKAPVVTLLSLELPDAGELLDRAMSVDPLCRVVVASTEPNIVAALDAVARGATDLFIHAEESLSVLIARVRRAVLASRQQREALKLIDIMNDLAGISVAPEADLGVDLLPEQTELERLYDRALQSIPPLEPIRTPHDIESALGRGPDERREHVRFHSSLEVRIRALSVRNAWVEGRLRNWSVAGLFVRGRDLGAVGSRLAVEIPLDSLGEVITVAGTVVWSVDQDPRPELGPGIGVFLDPNCHSAMWETLSATTELDEVE